MEAKEFYKRIKFQSVFPPLNKAQEKYVIQMMENYHQSQLEIPSTCPHCNSNNNTVVDDRWCLDCNEPFTSIN